jgi:2-methylcitrate dehydratase PrpD
MDGVTRQLARFLVSSQLADIPPVVRHEGARAILNWLGCALGGCGDVTVERLLAGVRDFAGKPQSTLLGRSERLDALSAALVNAVSSNVLDFDDTHLRSVIHPTVPVAAAVFALAEHVPVSGAQALHAVILGAVTECRIGNAVSPEHYEIGWHITATCGVFGAAAACGRMLQLSEQQMTWALGIAATQASGLTAMLGSMSKCLNMGHAARNGLAAALLAAKDFTSSDRALEAPRGFAHVLSPRRDLDEILDGLGARWELMQNAYKPYPCGIVVHPVIDACLELRSAHRVACDTIERVTVRVHPLVIALTGNAAPATGLQAKLSTQHCAAAALLYGKVGVDAFTDARAQDPAAVALRARVVLQPDEAVAKEAAHVGLTLTDGSTLEKAIAHATGSLERPMTDAQLEAKFHSLASPRFTPDAIENLIAQCWGLEQAPDAGALPRATAPEDTVDAGAETPWFRVEPA